MVTPVSPIKPKTASEPANDRRVENPVPLSHEVLKYGIGATTVALATYFAYRLGRRKDDRSHFIAAGAKFREAFTADIVAIQSDRLGHLDLTYYLRAAHDDRHATAVLAFEKFVLKRRLASLHSAWNRYRYGENDDGSPASPESKELDHDELYFLCYSEPGRIMEKEPNKPAKQRVLERLHALMSFSEA